MCRSGLRARRSQARGGYTNLEGVGLKKRIGIVGRGGAALGGGELDAVVAGASEVTLGPCLVGEVERGAGCWFAVLAVLVAGLAAPVFDGSRSGAF